MRCGSLADRTDRPVGRYPFTRGVGEHGGQPNEACLLVDRGGLHGRDLVLAQSLADEVEPTGERGIAERAVTLSGEWGPYGGDQRLLRIGEFNLSLGESGRNGADRFTGALHGRPPVRAGQS